MTEVRLRPVQAEDLDAIHAMRIAPGVVWGTTLLPTAPLAEVKAEFAPAPHLVQLVAELAGQVVGHIYLILGQGRTRHSAELGIYVQDGYQGLGLGKRLMAGILEVADRWLMLERVWLDVFADNARAIRLYESMGFVTEGRCRGVVRRDGALVDALHMGRLRGRAQEAAPPADAAPGEGGRCSDGPAPEELVILGLRPSDIPESYTIRMEPTVMAGMSHSPAWSPGEQQQELSSLPAGQHVLVAVIGGQVAGYVHITQHPGRRGHSGTLTALAVGAEWQNRGVGTALARSAVNLTGRWLGLTRLDVQAQADDAAAVSAFRGAGFTPEVRQRAALVRDGRYVDTFLMAWVDH